MIRIMIVGPEKAPLPALAAGLEQHAGVALTRAPFAKDALVQMADQRFNLVVAGEALEDMSGLDLIRKTIALNPMINSAVVSTLAADAFHDASEGLGVLMPISPTAGSVQATELLHRLQAVLGLTVTVPAAS